MRRRICIAPVSIGFGYPEPRQGGAERAGQKDRLDQIAPRLLDRQRRKLAVVQRAFGHHPVDRQTHLLGNLRQRQLRHRGVAAPLMRQQPVCVFDGAFATLDRDIHSLGPRNDGGARQRRDVISRDQQQIDAARKQRAVGRVPLDEVLRQSASTQARRAANAGPAERQLGTPVNVGSCRINVVERSG
jgi:hypothetical protein